MMTLPRGTVAINLPRASSRRTNGQAIARPRASHGFAPPPRIDPPHSTTRALLRRTRHIGPRTVAARW